MNYLKLVVFLFFIKSCETNPNLNGIWVPEKIEWKSPNVGIEEIDSSLFSSFKTLHLMGNNKLLVYQTTNTKDEKDSLIFQSEPGIRVFSGSWKFENKEKLKFDYVLAYQLISVTGIKTTYSKTALYNSGKIIFEDNSYVLTSKYDQESLKKLIKYSTKF